MTMLSIKTSDIPPALPPFAFVFKANPFPDDKTPFLVPVINRPDFDILQDQPPGILQYIQGNLGITKTMFSSVLAASAPGFDGSDQTPSSGQFLSAAIPEDSGLLSFEKMAIQSMMESQKPVIEMVQIFIDMLAIVEDAICRFLGSSIKVPIVNITIGIPSKSPFYTKAALNYDADNAMNAKFISDKNRDALNLTMDAFKETAELFGGIPGNSKFDIDDYTDEQKAYYIGYFDENGTRRLPPEWVRKSNKWFGEIWGLTDNQEQSYQLSTDMDKGVQQLSTKHSKNLNLMDIEKINMQNQYSRQIQEEQNDVERTNLTNGKEKALNHLQEVIDSAQEGIDQSVYTEWFTKNSTAQVKNLYKEPFISTAEPVTDKKGEPKDPYVEFPKLHIQDGIEVEIPVVESENQIIRKNIKENGKKREKIVGLNTTKGSNGEVVVAAEKPEDTNILYFSHIKSTSRKQSEIKETKVPEDVKNHYISHDFDIVLNFEIRQVSTGKVIGTEQEVFPQEIDFETDYLLRLIRVVNTPINQNVDLLTKTFDTKSGASTFLKESILSNTTKNVGTAYNTGNNIPEQYDKATNGENNHYADILDEDNNLYEAEVLHGVDPRYSGMSIRSKRVIASAGTAVTNDDGTVTPAVATYKRIYYIEQKKNKVFWLVEAIKVNDENGTVKINNVDYDVNSGAADTKDDNADSSGGGGGKEWYGLLDKFTVIPLLVGKLVALIARKFIPLLIKVVQIITDPRKLADLVFLIITEKLSKYFGMFDTKFDPRAAQDKASMKGDAASGSASKFNYQAPATDKDGGGYFYAVPPAPKNVTDGKASVEIFGFFIGMSFIDGEGKLYYDKGKYEEATKDLPDQTIMTLVLNIIKMPFDIIEKIINFFLEFIKKLVNPLKLIPAVIEFITFKWLLDILKPDVLGAVIGLPEGDQFSNYEDTLNSKDKDRMNSEIVNTLQGDNIFSEYVEVLVYNLFKNGEFIREERVERPIDYENTGASDFPPPGVTLDDEIRKILDDARKNPANKEAPDNPLQSSPLYCGLRNISLNTFIPIPFLSQSPDFNLCDLIQLFLKPLELILAILRMIQAMIQSLIALPFSIFGLAPYIPIPKVDFVTPIENKIKQLAESLSKNIVITDQPT